MKQQMKHLTGRYAAWACVMSLCCLVTVQCGRQDTKGGLAAKKATLEKLQAEASKLTTQIEKLEKEIALEDTAAGTVKKRVRLVSLDTLRVKPFIHYTDILGMVSSDAVIQVTAQMPGNIARILVQTGQQVSAGQTVATLDDAIIQQGIAEIQNQLDFARDIYTKQKALWDQKIGSEVQYLSAKNNLEALEKRLATSKEQWKLARIVAPVSGTVDEVYARVGGAAAPGVPIIRLVNKSGMKIKGAAADSYAGRIRKGQKVLCEFPDLNKTAQSTITYTGSIIDPVNRTFIVEAALPAGVQGLPNMVSLIKIEDYRKPAAIIIPVNVVQKDTKGDYVYVSQPGEGGMRCRKAYVTLGQVYNEFAEINAGLKAGDLLVTEGYQTINENEYLSIQ